jgi:hypothetical protein
MEEDFEMSAYFPRQCLQITPAAKMKKAVVYANDLNPNSYESLCKNIKLNKVKTEIKCSNLDGREFIRSIIKPDLLQRWANSLLHFSSWNGEWSHTSKYIINYISFFNFCCNSLMFCG